MLYEFASKKQRLIRAMLSKLTPKHNNDVFKQILGQVADGYLAALRETAQSATISGTILGGVAPAGGPLTGGLLTCTPGTLAAAAPDLMRNLRFGPVTMKVDKKTLHGNTDTEHMRAIRKLLAQCVTSTWTSWAASWFATALPVAQGGVAAWVPATPPTPGPWTAGTVSVFGLAPLGGIGGVGPDPSLPAFVTTTVAQAKVTPWTFTMPEGNGITLNLVNPQGSTSEMEMTAYAYGWQWLMQDFVQSVQVQDPTHVGASGIAAPGGAITTGVIAGLKLMVS